MQQLYASRNKCHNSIVLYTNVWIKIQNFYIVYRFPIKTAKVTSYIYQINCNTAKYLLIFPFYMQYWILEKDTKFHCYNYAWFNSPSYHPPNLVPPGICVPAGGEFRWSVGPGGKGGEYLYLWHILYYACMRTCEIYQRWRRKNSKAKISSLSVTGYTKRKANKANKAV